MSRQATRGTWTSLLCCSSFIARSDKQYIPLCLEVTRGNSSVGIVTVGYELDDVDDVDFESQ